MSKPVNSNTHTRPTLYMAGLLALSCLAFLASLHVVSAAAGDIDKSFGGTGRLRLGAGDAGSVTSIAVQPDGKLVASLYYSSGGNNRTAALARVNPADGSLDTTFGTNGLAPSDLASAIALQADGKIVLTGQIIYTSTSDKPDIFVSRYNADGSPDSSFGTNGRVTTDFFGREDSASALLIQPDGKIVVAGAAYTGDTSTGIESSSIALARYNADGSLDSSFGTNGKLTTDFADRFSLARAITVQTDGKLVVAGKAMFKPAIVNDDIAVLRYNTDGSLDSTFGTGGFVLKDISATDDAYDVVLQANGQIVVGGTAANPAQADELNDFALLRLNTDGTLDSTFGTGGFVLTDYQKKKERVVKVLIQADGKLIAAGDLVGTATAPASAWLIARYNADGTLDASFGTAGFTKTDGVPLSSFRDAVLQADNKIVAGGEMTYLEFGTTAALVRYHNDGTAPLPTPTPAVGFSADTYKVNEGDPSGVATVTITRQGDLSGTVAVDYGTQDTAGLKPCQEQSASASERCDFATSFGTLRFAAGEVSKTIQIPIINDRYPETAEKFTIHILHSYGTFVAGSFGATVIIEDDDAQTPTQNPIAEQGFFIKEQYIDFLGRVAEQAGFDFWMNRMNNCPAGQTCDRIDTSKRFFQSDEFQARGFLVYRLYDAILGRLPKYTEFVNDVARLNGFQTPEEQRQSKDAYLTSFTGKLEFFLLYRNFYNGSKVTDPTGFVNALCDRAGISPASKQTLINNLQSGARTPEQTLEDFIQTPEISGVGTKFYDRGFITMQYFGYLRRDPEQAGFDFWVSQLIGPNAPHRGDYRFMVGGFLQSDEYNLRFAPLSATH
jgi:uncharacterized delta-60 repeat protein